MTELIETAKTFFKDAEESPEGKWLLRGHIKNYLLRCQFELKDDAPFYVEIIDGKIQVQEGTVAVMSYEYPRISVNKKNLIDIFKGKFRPYEAKWSNKWDIRWRDRRGAIFTTLVRIGQDVVRERIIQNA